MTAVTHGGDPQRLREIGGQLGSCAHGLDGVGDHGDVQMRVLVDQWAGTDMEHFAGRWPDVRQAISAAAEHCRDMAQALDRNAGEQDQASSGAAGDVGSGIGSFMASSAPSLAAPTLPGSSPPRERPPDLDDAAMDSVPPEVQEKWTKYTDEEKLAILEQIVEEEAKAYGIEPTPLVTVKSIDGWGLQYDPNLWNRGNGRIVLNEDLLDSPEMLVAVSHEMRHAMQGKAIDDANVSWWEGMRGEEETYDNGVTPEDVEAWEEPYIQPEDDPEGYFDQPVEADAETEGRQRASELTPEELDRLLKESQT